MYKPQQPFNVPCKILSATYEKINGANVKTYAESGTIFVSAKSYGGTEKVINGTYVIVDTLNIETYYRPDIKSQDRIQLLDDDSTWEILNTPEDIDRMHKWLKFKVQRIHGAV